MPNLNQLCRSVFFLCLLVFAASCNTAKFSIQHAHDEVEIAQLKQSPYMHQPENALTTTENVTEAKLSGKPSGKLQDKQVKTPKKSALKINAAERSIVKLKKIAPQTRPLLQTAGKEWKPRKENFNLGWKDVLFVIILLALLALLCGFLYSALGLNLTITLIIAIVLAFLAMWVYLWYLHNP